MVYNKHNNNSQDDIRSIFQFNEQKLINFYSKVYSYRTNRLENLWKWLYRIEFLFKKNPVIAVNNKKIIGHMGLIPFWLNLKGKKVTAAWYADMHVLPKHRGKGVATKITEKLMKLTDIYLSFGNDQSMNIFKKYGWIKTYETNLHYFFLEPMNHPKFIRYTKYLNLLFIAMNFIFKYIITLYHYLMIDKKDDIKIEFLNEKNIKFFINDNLSYDLTNTIKDKEYLTWRFLDSPDIKLYKVFIKKNRFAAIVKIRKDKPASKHLDILLINDLSNYAQISSLIRYIILWGRKNNFSYIRTYISNKSLSKKIKKNLFSIVAKPRFACFSYNKEYMKILKNTIFEWHLADSDFEFIS